MTSVLGSGNVEIRYSRVTSAHHEQSKIKFASAATSNNLVVGSTLLTNQGLGHYKITLKDSGYRERTVFTFMVSDSVSNKIQW